MLQIYLLIISLFCCLQYNRCLADKNANINYYIAGAIEFMPELEIQSPERTVANNLRAYLELIDIAKNKNVDILVFPEATLNYYGLEGREQLLQQALVIPDPREKIAPCDSNGTIYSEVLKELSQKCKNKQIYVLVNIVEKVPCSLSNSICKHPRKTYKDGFDLFNTNIVFDRFGRVISRYRKLNLFVEPYMDESLTGELATFTTDFGVKFGHFICFDILFKNPALDLVTKENVTHFLYPVMWFSDLPFLTSEQTHHGWAHANNVNLITAGASNPAIGNTGTGIYLGNREIPNVIMSSTPVRKLLTAKIPKDIGTIVQNLKKRQQHTPVEMKSLHVSEIWTDQGVLKIDIMNEETQNICAYEDICCTYNIKMKHYEIPVGKIAYRYMLVANYTTRIFAHNRKSGELYCAIIPCTSTNLKSCGRHFKDNRNFVNSADFESISIKAKIRFINNNKDDILVMPNTLETSFLPLDTTAYSFNKSIMYEEAGSIYQDYTMTTNHKISNLLVFGMYGRNFALDEL